MNVCYLFLPEIQNILSSTKLSTNVKTKYENGNKTTTINICVKASHILGHMAQHKWTLGHNDDDNEIKEFKFWLPVEPSIIIILSANPKINKNLIDSYFVK